MITIHIDAGDLQKCLNQIDKYSSETQVKVKQQIFKSAINIQKYAKAMAPKSRGGAGLSGSIRVRREANGLTVHVGTDRVYASAMEFGLKNRKPIYPRFKKAIAFGSRLKVGGKLAMTPGGSQKRAIVVKYVLHPGDIAPRPFLRPAIEREKPEYIKSLIEILNRKK
jgi:HK97 gp10 family phage protein